jgi:hypothetical protein
VSNVRLNLKLDPNKAQGSSILGKSIGRLTEVELHDHLQQMLVVGKLTIGQGKRSACGAPAYESVLNKVDDILSDALAYSRTLVADRSPPVLRDHVLILNNLRACPICTLRLPDMTC